MRSAPILMHKMCPRCGTEFPLEYKHDGTVGIIEGVRWIRRTGLNASRWRRAKWRVAATLYDVAAWIAR